MVVTTAVTRAAGANYGVYRGSSRGSKVNYGSN